MPSYLRRRGFGLALCLCLTLVLALACALPGRALDLNGFLAPKGHTDLALSYTVERYDHFWRGTVKRPNPPFLGEVENKTESLWFRYGITDRINLIGNAAYVDSSGDGSDRLSESGLQDFEALIAFRLFETGSSVRQSLLVAGGGRTPMSDYLADGPVSIGDHSTDVLARLVYQVEAGSFYFSQQVGYDLRGDDVPDGYPLYTELGYGVGRVSLIGYYQQYYADGGSDIGDDAFTFPGNQDEFQRIGAKVFVRVNQPFGVFVAGFKAIDGRNSGDITGYSAGATLGF